MSNFHPYAICKGQYLKIGQSNLLPCSVGVHQICDMIKRNDVANTDFELQAKIGGKCLCFILYCFELQRISHISVARCSIEMGFGSKCRI